MKKLWTGIAAALVISLLLSGGTDKTDVNRMVFIVGIGIDREEDEFAYTFYTAVPTGSDTAVSENNVRYESVTVIDDSFALALRQFERDSSKEISLEHLNCCALGKSMENENLSSVLDYLLRDPSVRRQCTLVLLDTGAKDFFGGSYSGSIAAGVSALAEQQDDSGNSGGVMTLGGLKSSLQSGSFCLYILGSDSPSEQTSASDASAPGQIKIRGLAVYTNGHLTGKLTPAQAELSRLFGDRQASGMLTSVDEDGHEFHYRVTYSRCRREFTPSQPISGNFDITVECILVSADGPEDHRPDEQQLADSLHRQLYELLDLSRTSGSAFTGLEAEARQSDRKWYREHRYEWQMLYRSALLELRVKCEIEQFSG